MENKWAETLKSAPPKSVDVEIKNIYSSVSKRPEAFEVKYVIDGKSKKVFFETSREDRVTIDDIYADIAKEISDSIDSEWVSALLLVEHYGDAAEFDATFIDSDTGSESDIDISYNVFRLFKELKRITSENGSNKWNRAKFTLMPSGDFTIDFEWDQSLADEIEANS